MTAQSFIITVANHKGGVGKTTVAVNLSAALASTGYKVLLIDLDPQYNATTFLSMNDRALEKNLLRVFFDGLSFADQIVPTAEENLSMIPASGSLTKLDDSLRQTKERMRFLGESLTAWGRQGMKEDTFVVIDCPPSMGMLTVSALLASHKLLIPVCADFFSLAGLSQILETNRIIHRVNPVLSILGILVNTFDARTNIAREVLSALQTQYGALMFRTIVPRSVRLAESPSFGKSIFSYDPAGSVSALFSGLSQEVLERLRLSKS